ncbi:substrate-binding domain-containing protein [Corallococcus exercitus]|uniref:substrate-binding domain-containing protein n=1 Tax=Corallococcus exercitus TaxID=2316736 RepID=UPI0035D420BF
MSVLLPWTVGLLLFASGAGPAPSSEPKPERVLRVCADPNNLPFSNARGEGFENRLAELLGRELKARVEYTWWAQRRGFIRGTLKANLCDVVMGVPTELEMVLPTRPYYRSTYVFVTKKDGGPKVRSFDDPVLHQVKVGVHLVGDDFSNTPPAHALTRRGIIQNVVGYTLYGDYAEDSPPSALVEAVRKGDVDVAVVWGPLAGYQARRPGVPLTLSPVSPQVDPPGLVFAFDIAVGVRKGDKALRDELDAALTRRKREVRALLTSYGVPSP